MTAVYCITDGSHCKIGISSEPDARLSTLQAGNPNAISLLWQREVDSPLAARVERNIHKHLFRAKRHIRGEWFAIGPVAAHKLVRLVERSLLRDRRCETIARLRFLAERRITSAADDSVGTPMTLSEYIKKHGRQDCAKRFGVSLRTVDYWARGDFKPQRKEQLPRVMKESGLSLADIYR